MQKHGQAYKDAPVCRAALRNSNVLINDMVHEYCRPMADIPTLVRGWELTRDVTEGPKTVAMRGTDAVPRT